MSRAKQATLKGFERTKIAALEKAAEQLEDDLEDEKAAKKKREKSFDKLVAVMRENKVTRYLDENVDPPLEVLLDEGKVKIKLRRRKSETPPEAAAGLN